LGVLQQLPGSEAASEVPLAQYFLGLVKLDLGEYDPARELFAQSLERQRAAEDRYGIALALNEMAGVALHLGQYSAARELVEEALALRRSIGDQHGIAVSLSAAGELALELGEFDQAQALLQECAEYTRRLGKRAGQPYALHHLGWLADARGDYETARRHFGDSLAFNRDSGNAKEVAHDLLGLGQVALHAGDAVEAERLHQESLGLSRQAGYRSGMVRALVGLGDAAQARQASAAERPLPLGRGVTPAPIGALDRRAYDCYEEALQAARAMSALPWVLAAAVGMATVCARAGNSDGAAEVLTMTVYHPASSHRTRQRAARLLSRLEAELPADQVGQAEERGRHSQLDEALGRLLDFHLPPA
jgi:tetratricopeptide (TPR) repeat protein